MFDENVMDGTEIVLEEAANALAGVVGVEEKDDIVRFLKATDQGFTVVIDGAPVNGDDTDVGVYLSDAGDIVGALDYEKFRFHLR